MRQIFSLTIFCTTSPSRTGGLEARLRTADRIALDKIFFKAVVMSKIIKFQNMMSIFIENVHLIRAQSRESTSVFFGFSLSKMRTQNGQKHGKKHLILKKIVFQQKRFFFFISFFNRTFCTQMMSKFMYTDEIYSFETQF